jgi:hypothetical protein
MLSWRLLPLYLLSSTLLFRRFFSDFCPAGRIPQRYHPSKCVGITSIFVEIHPK